MNGSKKEQGPKLCDAEREKTFQGYDQGTEQWLKKHVVSLLGGRSELISLVGSRLTRGIRLEIAQKKGRGEKTSQKIFIETATC